MQLIVKRRSENYIFKNVVSEKKLVVLTCLVLLAVEKWPKCHYFFAFFSHPREWEWKKITISHQFPSNCWKAREALLYWLLCTCRREKYYLPIKSSQETFSFVLPFACFFCQASMLLEKSSHISSIISRWQIGSHYHFNVTALDTCQCRSEVYVPRI